MLGEVKTFPIIDFHDLPEDIQEWMNEIWHPHDNLFWYYIQYHDRSDKEYDEISDESWVIFSDICEFYKERGYTALLIEENH